MLGDIFYVSPNIKYKKLKKLYLKMATYNPFGKLIKITTWSAYSDAQQTGNIVFVDANDDNGIPHKIIWANGIEYNIADSSQFDALYHYVHDTVDASVNDLEAFTATMDASLIDISTIIIPAIDSSLKAAIKATTLGSAVGNNIATITLTTTTEGEVDASNAYTVKGDNYVKINEGTDSSIAIALNVANTVDEIEHATGTDSSVATSFAVKSYVDTKMSAARAMNLKGNVSSLESLNTLVNDPSTQIGDTYVVTEAFGNGTNEKFEVGDMVVFKADYAVNASTPYFVVERNLDGAVTSGDEFEENTIVLGNGGQSLKKTNWGIGAETAHTAAENTLGTELWVKSQIDALDISVKSTDTTYITTAKNSSLGVDVSANVVSLVDVSNGIENGEYTVDGLASAADVHQVIVENEEVVASVIATLKSAAGFNTELGLEWSDGKNLGANLRDAIEKLKDEIDETANNKITGEEALGNVDKTTVNNTLVAVTTTTNASGDTTLGSAVRLANAPAISGGATGATATGLATDAYVKDYVYNALLWEVYDGTDTPAQS